MFRKTAKMGLSSIDVRQKQKVLFHFMCFKTMQLCWALGRWMYINTIMDTIGASLCKLSGNELILLCAELQTQ